jgi:tetratricopeptide (TPR) repeat protein
MLALTSGHEAGTAEDFEFAVLTAAELNLRGIQCHSRGDFQGALGDFREAQELDPEYAEAWNNSGIVRQELGDLTGAVDDFYQAIAIRRSYSDALNNRARARQLLGDLEAALRDYDTALDCAEARFAPTVHHNRGMLRLECGDLTGALADFDEALQALPDRVFTLVGRADARKRSGDLAGAASDLDRALQVAPESECPMILHRRGGIRALEDDFVGAVADYEDALRLNPGFAMAYLSRGHARYHLRDRRGLQDYRTALEMDPETTIRELARLFREDVARDPSAVLANCEKHLRINPQDVLAYVRRGMTLLLLGQDPRADLERFSAMAPDLRGCLHRLVDEVSRSR